MKIVTMCTLAPLTYRESAHYMPPREAAAVATVISACCEKVNETLRWLSSLPMLMQNHSGGDSAALGMVSLLGSLFPPPYPPTPPPQKRTPNPKNKNTKRAIHSCKIICKCSESALTVSVKHQLTRVCLRAENSALSLSLYIYKEKSDQHRQQYLFGGNSVLN